MTYLWLPVGMLLPTLIGFFMICHTEGKTPVLFRYERWCSSFVLGGIATTYVFFLFEVLGIGNFGLLSMLITQVVILFALVALYKKRALGNTESPKLLLRTEWKLWQTLLATIGGLWVLSKIISGSLLVAAPAYFDDTVSNWNLRGKAFFEAKELVLELEPGKIGVSTYPPSVPLLKTWLANLNGSFHEGLVNSIHMVWYLCALALLFFALKRLFDTKWSLLGTYILASIPLFLMHGSAAYADCLLAVIVFLAVSFLFSAMNTRDEKRCAFLRLSALTTGLLVFTKNESILLHLPPIAVLALVCVALCELTPTQKKRALLWYAVSILSVLIPWLAFKFANNLGFGNAKDISDTVFEWHEGVFAAIMFNTFMEGNWNLLPGLFIGLLLFGWKTVLRTPLLILVAFFFMVWLGQLPIYMFTGLYIEAVNQTGYARGIIHLIPTITFIVTILLVKTFSERE